MTQYIVRRLLHFMPVLLLVTVVIFVITMLLPGDAARAALGEVRGNDKIAYEAMRQELGLDRPIPVQYVMWLGRAVQGDFGKSVRTREPVIQALAARLPITLELSLLALIIGVVIAIPAGIVSAVRPNSLVDRIGTVFATGGAAIPHFWKGIIFIYIFAMWLQVLPSSGYVRMDAGIWPNIRSLILPALSLGLGLSAVIMRQTRSALIEVLRQDYVTVARAKGLSENSVVMNHALKNAIIPVATVIGLQMGRLVGGTVIVETIFALPGVGRVAADSIFFRDFPMLQGVVVVMALAVLLSNFLVDVLYAYLDPRIRYW
ncbi:MAG: ABC transporter permease [Chloroflexota bacterium]